MPRPSGGFADLPMAGMAAHDAELAFDLAFPKMLRAVHFKHTGSTVPGFVPTETAII
jgi:hypothetical protein